jgi:hypothetical protein
MSVSRLGEQRSNSHNFVLRDDIWDAAGVCEVTDKLTAAARTLD